MLLTSIDYVVFGTIVLSLFSVVPSRYRVLILLAASYGFYAGFSPYHLVILVALTGATHLFGASRALRHRGVLVAVLVLLLLPLLVLKYSAFLAELATGRSDAFHPSGSDLLVPVGLSFITFQAISYVVDVHRLVVPRESSFMRVALYLAFFPKLLAGPIERGKALLPQLANLRSTTGAQLHAGLKVALWGYFCKLVVADNLARLVDGLLQSPAEQSGSSLVVGSVLYSFQIYFDFMGYAHIAVGTARCFSIELTPNFDRPYAATSLRDFWRRWHISLSAWFRDYVYVPLGGNRTYGLPRVGALMLLFLVSGLWHGASLTFVAWGAFHGVAYLVEDGLRRLGAVGRVVPQLPNHGAGRWLKRFVTFLTVTVGWVLFRSPDVSSASQVLERALWLDRSAAYWSLNEMILRPEAGWFILLLAGALWLDGSTRIRDSLANSPATARQLLAELAYVNVLAVTIVLFGDLGVRDFTYFRF